MIHQWEFTLEQEALKMEDTTSGSTTLFLKRDVVFYPKSDDILVIDNLSTNVKTYIKRSDSVIPVPGATMEDYIDSLVSIASA